MNAISAVLERDLRRMLRNPLTLACRRCCCRSLYLLILGNSLQGPLKGLRARAW